MREKRFWDMTQDEVEAWIETRGIEAWKAKVVDEQSNHLDELRQGANPWFPGREDERRQRVIESLAPDIADDMRREARQIH